MTSTAVAGIGSQPGRLEVEWWRTGERGPQPNGLHLRQDEVVAASLAGLDNGSIGIDRAALGAITGVDPGTVGDLVFDDFEAYRN